MKDGDGKSGDGAAGGEADAALRHEQAKNQVLLAEVVALEDELVNRSMEEFDAVMSDQTRPFWREQLLTNREPALAALQELATAKAGVAGDGGARRPLHNRAVARPVPRTGAAGAAAGAAAGGGGDGLAAKIRNRASEIERNERVPFAAAFRRAERELGGR